MPRLIEGKSKWAIITIDTKDGIISKIPCWYDYLLVMPILIIHIIICILGLPFIIPFMIYDHLKTKQEIKKIKERTKEYYKDKPTMLINE